MIPESPAPTTPSPTQVRVGLIGAGARGAGYFRAVPDDVEVTLAAIADPSSKNRRAFIDRFAADHQPTEYEDGLKLLSNEELDAVIITAPNFAHLPYATEAMSRAMPLMLEKPVATTVDDLAALWSAHRRSDGPQPVVGFVLRYTPFYSAIREVVRSGDLGEILSIEANENLGTGLTMVQYRGWRQDTEKSGGWMVEKCCHDLDILSYLLDSRPTRVFSMASALHLRPRPESEQLARFQPEAGTAALDFGDPQTNAALADRAQHSPYAPSNLPDRQVATLEFENGTLATFTAVMAQPKTTRRIRIFGTDAMLEGDITERTFRVIDTDPAGGKEPKTVTEFGVTVGDSGHNGGDEVLGDTFWHLAAGQPRDSRAGLSEGIDAVLTAIALQESAETGQPIALAPWRRIVFGEAATS